MLKQKLESLYYSLSGCAGDVWCEGSELFLNHKGEPGVEAKIAQLDEQEQILDEAANKVKAAIEVLEIFSASVHSVESNEEQVA